MKSYTIPAYCNSYESCQYKLIFDWSLASKIWFWFMIKKSEMSQYTTKTFETKSQLISKADWRAIDSPKKRMDEFVLFAFLLFTNQICPFVFWENLRRANLLFGSIWPLQVYCPNIYTVSIFIQTVAVHTESGGNDWKLLLIDSEADYFWQIFLITCFLTSKNETTNSPIHQFTNLECCKMSFKKPLK